MKCFVISPIGSPESAIRKHADDVYECVIEPAFTIANVKGHRADHVKDVGRISETMFSDILGADFCIAVLKDYNPNVFYEIAVAHSAGIPVILMSEMGVNPPFDLADERTFHYDLNPRAVHRKENPTRLAEMIESVRRLDGERRVPFGAGMTPLNAADNDPTVRVIAASEGSATFWQNLINTAKERIYIGGLGFTSWRGIPDLDECLAATAQRNCEVRVMTMHGINPSTRAMINPDIAEFGAEDAGERFELTRDWFRRALKSNPRAEVRPIRKGMMYQQTIIVDDQLYLWPYLYWANTEHSPRIECAKGFPLFVSALDEFKSLWEANDPVVFAPKKQKAGAKASLRSKKPASRKVAGKGRRR